jgi:hypothetical protein
MLLQRGAAVLEQRAKADRDHRQIRAELAVRAEPRRAS